MEGPDQKLDSYKIINFIAHLLNVTIVQVSLYYKIFYHAE